MNTHGAVTLSSRIADHSAARLLRPARFVLRQSPALAVAFVGLGTVMHFLPGRPVLTVDSFFHLSNTFNFSPQPRARRTPGRT